MLHELLSRHRDEIVARCERKLRARHPDRPPEEVVDTLPAFFDELVKAERREAGLPERTTLPMEIPHAKEHGQQRFHCGYKISDIAIDFGVISDSIGEVAIEEDFFLDPRSYKLLNECIDRAIAESLDEYFELTKESEEADTVAWLGSLGHELRNALGSAMMAFSVLKSGQLGIESRTAHVLDRSLRRLGSLIDQTLTSVRLRSGQPIVKQSLNLHDLVDDILAGLVNERRVSMHNNIEQALDVEADANLFESALSNLIQNAVKYSRPGGHVDIRAGLLDTGFVIEVEDECGGLGGKDPEQLFDRFVQGEERRGGVGLGLCIARQAIDAHGGHIRIRDLAPKGCVVTIWLPR